MATNNSTRNTMRVLHRYLGFFLVGIMGVYAISGMVMVFRNTDFLKQEKIVERSLDPNLTTDELGPALRIRDFKVSREEAGTVYFNNGEYNTQTGIAKVTVKELPYVLNKMTQMHKATTDRPLFFLNIFFGLSLLFFVISSFWMFIPGTNTFKKGLYFTLAGLILALVMIFI